MISQYLAVTIFVCVGAAGQTDGNQRYSSLAGITPANLKKLGGAWMTHIADGVNNSNLEATPVVVDGVMYLPGAAGTILAIDAATGAIKWKYQPHSVGVPIEAWPSRKERCSPPAAAIR